MNQHQARLPRRSRARVEAQSSLQGWPMGVRGISALTPLVMVLTAGLMAVIAQVALLAPHARIVTTLESLNIPLTAVDPPPAYGACGDICSQDHRCRHVVLRDGLHNGSRVGHETLMAAASCH